MPGNSQRRGRRTSSKKVSTAGSGGKNRAASPAAAVPCRPTNGHGTRATRATSRCRPRPAGSRPTSGGRRPPRAGRPRSASRAPRSHLVGCTVTPTASRVRVVRSAPGRRRPDRRVSPRVGGRNAPREAAELLVGRNPVLEALRTRVPATSLYVASGIDIDERVTEIVRTAGDHGLPLLEISRAELDRMTGGVLHQGVGAAGAAVRLRAVRRPGGGRDRSQPAPLLVALDGVTDPRNLGAVIRSAAAFGAQGVFLPERRAAGMTATAWRTSAGAAARVPVAQVTNLTRALKSCQDKGFRRGRPGRRRRDARSTTWRPPSVRSSSWSAPRAAACPGWSAQTCDLRVSIPIASTVESLNASVAAVGDAGRGSPAPITRLTPERATVSAPARAAARRPGRTRSSPWRPNSAYRRRPG